MKNKKFFLILFLFGLAITSTIVSCKKDDDVPQDGWVAISDFLQKSQNAKHDYLIGVGSRSDVGQYYEDGGAMILAKMDHFNSETMKIQHWYTDYTSKVVVDSVQSTKDGYVVRFGDVATFTTNSPDSDKPGHFVITEVYGEPYRVKLKKTDGGYIIQTEEPLDNIAFPIGEMPLDFKINVPDPVSTDTVSTIDNNTVTNRSYNYNATTAKNYAHQYVDNPNSQFCNFYYGGGDCTNFVSQALWAGGFTMNSSNWWATMGGNCCNNSYGCLVPTCYHCNWTVADKFYNYIQSSGRIYSGCYIDNALSVGDIIQLGINGSAYHTTLVTKKAVVNGVTSVYVTYRTASPDLNRKDRLSTLMPDTHYGWKVKPSAS